MLDAALVVKGRNDSVYDAFRGRVIFPIIDLRGNVIGFGGRVIGSDRVRKYLNSSDTLAYKKSRNLFAMNFAKNAADKRVIFCEGYMDTVSMHQAGFDNAVATLGTALTPEQARLISHYTDEVILAYDSDEAGQKATRRATALFDEIGVKVRVLKIVGAKDPDEYIRSYGEQGPDPLQQLLLDASGSDLGGCRLARLRRNGTTCTSADEGKRRLFPDRRWRSCSPALPNPDGAGGLRRPLGRTGGIGIEPLRQHGAELVAEKTQHRSARNKQQQQPIFAPFSSRPLRMVDDINPEQVKHPRAASAR